MRQLASALLCATLALGLLTACGGKEASGQQPEGGSQSASAQQEEGTASALGSLVSFSADTLAGGQFTQDDIRAKDVTVVNFWSLSCGPCIAEMPALAEFAGALPDNVQLITVCLDGALAGEEASQLLEEAGFEGVTLVTADGDLLDLCRNLMYTPTTVCADSEGSLVGDAIIGGQRDLSGTLLAAVNRVLAAGGKDEISLET